MKSSNRRLEDGVGVLSRSGRLGEEKKSLDAAGIRTLKAVIFFVCDNVRGKTQFMCAAGCYDEVMSA